MDIEDDTIIQSVIDTIDLASTQRLTLVGLTESIKDAEKQVLDSATASRYDINKHFQHVEERILSALNQRKEALLNNVEEIEREALEPLRKCEEMINQNIDLAKNTLDEGKRILSGQNKDLESIKAFKNVEVKLNSLPAVPALADVVSMYTELPGDPLTPCYTEVKSYGRVVPRAPVQISEVIERPGAQLVKWGQLEDDHTADMTTFRLQFCYGENFTPDKRSSSAHVFKDAYEGPNMCHTVRHLTTGATYSFRVRGRSEGGEWCRWSVPLVAVTTIKPYAWQENTSGYECSNECKISCSNTDDASLIQYNNVDTPYECGHSIAFRILETGDEGKKDDAAPQGVCLMINRLEAEGQLMSNDILMVSDRGSVFLNGKETTTKLPALTRAATLTFQTEQVNSKVRVDVTANHKTVTLDWPLGSTSEAQQNRAVTFHYAIRFGKNWKIGVE